MNSVVVIGARGYTGAELLPLLYKHPEFGPLVNEVTEETSKVTWPTWDETKTNTVVTVIVTVIIAAILWGFDQVFGRLTNAILGGGA